MLLPFSLSLSAPSSGRRVKHSQSGGEDRDPGDGGVIHHALSKNRYTSGDHKEHNFKSA